MKFTIDQITAWADKLTYRLMVIIGVSDADLQKYLDAVQAKQNGVSAADSTLSPPLSILGFNFKNIGDAVLKIGGGLLAIVIAVYLYKRNKRR